MPRPRFHVRHNARPILIREILQILEGHDSLTLEDILETGRQMGCQVGTAMKSKQSLKENPIQTAKDLSLIAGDFPSLTDLGEQMIELLHYKPSVFNEVMHAFHYTLWRPTRATHHCFSWSYRVVCDDLWENGSIIIDRRQLVSKVSEMAMERFNTNRVSFSKDSVRGVLQWLSALDPPV
ncbi:MAG: hypothetical protein ACXADD_18315, partial [Candidatus Thorarchaeota archaeon]